MEPRGSFPCSQDPATAHYPGTDDSSPQPHILLL